MEFGVAKGAIDRHVAHEQLPPESARKPRVASKARSKRKKAAPSAPLPRLRDQSAKASLEDLVGRIRALAKDSNAVDRYGQPKYTLRDRLAMANAERQAIRLYAELTGELSATEATIIASPAFKRATKRIIEALEPHPDALRAVVTALEELEAA